MCFNGRILRTRRERSREKKMEAKVEERESNSRNESKIQLSPPSNLGICTTHTWARVFWPIWAHVVQLGQNAPVLPGSAPNFQPISILNYPNDLITPKTIL